MTKAQAKLAALALARKRKARQAREREEKEVSRGSFRRSRLSVSLPRGLLREAKREAKKQETSVAVVIRRAVFSYLGDPDRHIGNGKIEAEFETPDETPAEAKSDANTDTGEEE